MDKFLTVKDVQSILKIGRNKTYNLIHQEDFPKIEIGRSFIIPEDKFNEYMNKHIYKKIEL